MRKNLLACSLVTILASCYAPQRCENVALENKTTNQIIGHDKRKYFSEKAKIFFYTNREDEALGLYLELRKKEGIDGLYMMWREALNRHDRYKARLYQNLLNKMRVEYFGEPTRIYGPVIPIYGPVIPERYKKGLATTRSNK